MFGWVRECIEKKKKIEMRVRGEMHQVVDSNVWFHVKNHEN